jgi:hypothetical protein
MALVGKAAQWEAVSFRKEHAQKGNPAGNGTKGRISSSRSCILIQPRYMLC